jgi:CRISPR/Cas system-associated protein Csm6
VFFCSLQITLFRLWHPRKPEYLLCADSEAEMEEWIGAILIEQYRHQANRLTVVQGALIVSYVCRVVSCRVVGRVVGRVMCRVVSCVWCVVCVVCVVSC